MIEAPQIDADDDGTTRGVMVRELTARPLDGRLLPLSGDRTPSRDGRPFKVAVTIREASNSRLVVAAERAALFLEDFFRPSPFASPAPSTSASAHFLSHMAMWVSSVAIWLIRDDEWPDKEPCQQATPNGKPVSRSTTAILTQTAKQTITYR
ncbi:hypothetical protein Aduo_008432 [Ancylostoma duodenale]